MAANYRVSRDQLEFTPESVIGAGQFGKVYKGKYLGTPVAIKSLLNTEDEDMQKYFERELETLCAIHHTNIVQLLGICITADEILIITEFVSGGDLRTRLKNVQKFPKLSWNLRVRIARDMALAMNYLHSQNRMHRDLKAANVLMGNNWEVKICDFGLARDTQGEGPKTVCGTSEWMAPEVELGEKYEKSADVFSFGMVVWELITREKPLSRNAAGVMTLLSWTPAAWKDKLKGFGADSVPPGFWKLFEDLLTKNGPLRTLHLKILAQG
eukprot:TRINITY_DN5533_c0_g1_i2.p1 TRINITY_DN5533_c0_g1~~TRINITY_DN5533_c0_g1_i2.p1  ORF type:complete len:269 (+),score=53.94 TRINITY_DN5533_c0_g1_i2:45-851(+)